MRPRSRGKRLTARTAGTRRGETDEGRIGTATAVPDLSIEGTFTRLELAGVRWVEVMRRGYFGNGWAWET